MKRGRADGGNEKEMLYETLKEYCDEGIVPMHMPGHKRNPSFAMENPYEMDVTEVTGLDNLHRPEGIIRQLMDWITQMYHSGQSYLLVNGSTCGILAAITACCRHGDRIVVARNCHKSVYHAIRLLELRPVYLYPSGEGGAMEDLGIAGIISACDVKRALETCKDAACVIVTSPTYEGVVSPVREIAKTVHDYGIPLIVDEAHGAHFNWHKAFPETALEAGADLVVESLHKTLPSLTQTGILHARFDLVLRERLEWGLQTFQSSSPSYVLMAGIDRCFAYIENEGGEAFESYAQKLRWFTEEMKELQHLYLFDSGWKENSKIVIATDRTKLTGKMLADKLLGKYRIETEMSCGNYCIAMTSVCDTEENFSRLAAALLAIDRDLTENQDRDHTGFHYIWEKPERRLYSHEVINYPRKSVSLAQAAGQVAAEEIYLYPPGIPIVAAGEVLSEQIVEMLLRGEKAGYEITGVEQNMVNAVRMEEFNG